MGDGIKAWAEETAGPTKPVVGSLRERIEQVTGCPSPVVEKVINEIIRTVTPRIGYYNESIEQDQRFRRYFDMATKLSIKDELEIVLYMLRR